MVRIGILFCALLCLAPIASTAQEGAPGIGGPIVDTIIIVTRNVYGEDEAQSSFLFKLANSIHVTTRSSVVRRELLFEAGEPYDSALVAETARNLRRMGLFQSAAIDTTRIDGRLAVVVSTADGWSTQPQINLNFTGEAFTWSAGFAERNFFGTATRVGAFYRKNPDRSAITLGFSQNRVLGSPVAISGVYDDLSDGVRRGWSIGVPWRANTDTRSFGVGGFQNDELIVRYRDGDTSAVYQRRSFLQAAQYSIALHATPARYVRLGLVGQLWHGAHIEEADTGFTVPDTTNGVLGLTGEIGWSRFKVVRYYNGFARDFDVDISSRISLTTWVAPTQFGYSESGIGADIGVQTGVAVGNSFAKLNARANGLLTGAGVDSGRVWLGLTVATQPFYRNATVFHVEAGLQRAPAPGTEYDIGHGSGPRAFGPHAFSGTRMFWCTIEHRAFLIDEIFGLLGLGFAAFVDYGGAWFQDQSKRLGGDVGAGIRFGPSRATAASVGRIDVAYRFGEGFDDKRWVVSFGRGFSF